MSYKVLDIYRDLPRTNCGDCGRGSCFAFATAVYLEARPLAECPHLAPEVLAAMEARLDAGRGDGDGPKAPSNEQALTALLHAMADLDLERAAQRCGGSLVTDPEPGIRLPFLGNIFLVTRGGVTCEAALDATIWVKIFLLIYVTRAGGEEPAGRWVAFRELPNTVSKSRSFEDALERVAQHFDGRAATAAAMLERFGARPATFGAADLVRRLDLLPRVPALFLFWEREDEFPARASLLLDAGVLGYLDQEALVFLAEAFGARLRGEGLGEIIP